MIAELALITGHWKLFAACTSLVAFALADVVSTAPAWSPEDLTLKVAAVVSLVFVVRLFLKEIEEHKKTMSTTIAASTAAMEKVAEALHTQNQFFDGIGKDAMKKVMDSASIGKCRNTPP